MKVIDVLNKIANGEEIPLIKYRDKILHWNKEKVRFEDKDGMNTLYEMDFSELNDEIEIIEDKINKDIKWYFIEEQENEETKIAQININFKILREKTTEIIDKLNEMEKE